ncbi:hypothetical protein RAS2_20980 [Phycisphaerae bacterium RAS2]|nr:hypothetical protein RAS2_20980 [Phycisphaerae bacterium RAS2]
MKTQATPLAASHFADNPNQSETLAHCLAAICAGWQRDATYGELCCALGTAMMVSCSRSARSVDRWNIFGRHAFVEEASRELGVELRPLHPPQAAPSPPAPDEFDLHWRDSYVPLVRLSLARGEPVLAWMGWPPPHDSQWGVITAIDIDGVARGLTPGCGSEPVRLVGPAVQAYCASAAEQIRRPNQDRLESMLRRFGSIVRNELQVDFGVMTGVAALAALREETNPEIISPVLRRMAADRAAAIPTLRALATGANTSFQSLLDHVAHAMDRQCECVARIEQLSAEELVGSLIELESRIAALLP